MPNSIYFATKICCYLTDNGEGNISGLCQHFGWDRRHTQTVITNLEREGYVRIRFVSGVPFIYPTDKIKNSRLSDKIEHHRDKRTSFLDADYL